MNTDITTTDTTVTTVLASALNSDAAIPAIRNFNEVRATIAELLIEYNQVSKETSKAVNGYEKTLLKIGVELVYASTNLTDAQFFKLKAEVAAKIGNDESNINKVVKIAKHRAIMDNKDRLPTGWGSLYLLTKIEPEYFDEFMADSGVSEFSTRKQIEVMITNFTGVQPVIKTPAVNLVVRPMKDDSLNPTSAEELEPLLAEFLLQHRWVISKPKTVASVKKTSSDTNVDSVADIDALADNESNFEEEVAA
jgi:hypothetical protein